MNATPLYNSLCYPHQYIDRQTKKVVTEALIADPVVNAIYAGCRENAKTLLNLLTSSRFSILLGYLCYDMPQSKNKSNIRRMIRNLNIDMGESVDAPLIPDSARKLFERKIKYWRYRPMIDNRNQVVSPADAKMIMGSFSDNSPLFIKDKFFMYEELLGKNKLNWLNTFKHGDFAIFRLTPEKYHYNHLPVSGKIIDFYEIDGCCNSCNPGAVSFSVTPYSKNHRFVTIIDTDVSGGTGIGTVAMIEIVALMIGNITQAYSEYRYNTPQNIRIGMFVSKGQPKSLFKPGSSVDVLIFQKNRIEFESDLIENLHQTNVMSRFSKHFDQSLVETDVQVRSTIATRKQNASGGINGFCRYD